MASKSIMSKQGSSSSSSYSTHLIDGEGKFNSSGLKSFAQNANLSLSHKSYTLISIMGPQSSGKSTLLNHLFKTKFAEMNANKGRSQTTLGIWLAKCVMNFETPTLVMDLEGCDGRERGDNDTSFEKQISLFALAVSDVVLINMWCHDIGREKGANKLLLRTIFQVMMRYFNPHQTTLLFVLRDKTETPLEKLEQILEEDTHEIWNSIPKPQSRKETQFSKFFNIKVVALSHYEEEMEEYLGEVFELREQLSSEKFSSGESSVPPLGFEQIWKTIRENKDLNIPPPSVMIAKVRCEEIASEKLEAFFANNEWRELLSKATSTTNPVSGFGNKISSLIDACLSQYDEDAQIYEDDIRQERRQMLMDNLMLRIKPAYDSALQVIIAGNVKEFKDALENDLKGGKGFRDAVDYCIERYSSQFNTALEDISIREGNWDCSVLEKEKFMNEINRIVGQARGGKLNDLIHEYKEKLSDITREPLEKILGNPGSQTWPDLRQLLETQSKEIADEYYRAVSKLGADQEISIDDLQTQFQGYLRQIIVTKAKTESPKVPNLMMDRFIRMFLQDSDGMPRSWDEDDIDINKIIRVAKTQSLKMLSAMAAIRLESGNDDDIEGILDMALLRDEDDECPPSYGNLVQSTWDGISKEDTLISPIKCATIWKKKFLTTTNKFTAQARETVEKAKGDAQVNKNPPPKPFYLFGLIREVATAIFPKIVPILTAISATANVFNKIQVDHAQYKYDKAEIKMGRRKAKDDDVAVADEED